MILKDPGILEEYDEALIIKLEQAKKEADEAEELNKLHKSKLDEFTQFLMGLEDEKAMEYAKRVPELLVPDDMRQTYEKLCQYVDSVMKKHN